jgi:hypothetical protein
MLRRRAGWSGLMVQSCNLGIDDMYNLSVQAIICTDIYFTSKDLASFEQWKA